MVTSPRDPLSARGRQHTELPAPYLPLPPLLPSLYGLNFRECAGFDKRTASLPMAPRPSGERYWLHLPGIPEWPAVPVARLTTQVCFYIHGTGDAALLTLILSYIDPPLINEAIRLETHVP